MIVQVHALLSGNPNCRDVDVATQEQKRNKLQVALDLSVSLGYTHVFSLKFNHGSEMVWASSPNSSGGAMWGPLPGDKWRFLKLDPKLDCKISSH